MALSSFEPQELDIGFPKRFHDTYSIRLLGAGAVESLYFGRRNVLTSRRGG